MIRTRRQYRSPEVDIDSHPLATVRERSVNLMWFFGVGDLAHRDTLADFVERFSMDSFPEGYFKEGYRPVPKGISSFMFLTNSVNPFGARRPS